jgi:hypothetical protein
VTVCAIKYERNAPLGTKSYKIMCKTNFKAETSPHDTHTPHARAHPAQGAAWRLERVAEVAASVTGQST